MGGAAQSTRRAPAELVPLLAEPGEAAILCDLDGTLAPIAERPGRAAIPERARALLRALARRFGLCAIVTGRRAVDAREIVGLEELTYAGIHGFELLRPGEAEAQPAPALRGHEEDAPRFAAELPARELEEAGVRVEGKGPIVGLHWRGAPDAAAAAALVRRIGAGAQRRGLVTHEGRKVLELRPAVAIDKGAAVETLVRKAGALAALYAGDDRTDLDAFRALARLREDGELRAVVRVGIRSAEGPEELAEEADLLVDGTDELLALLEVLAP